MYDATDTVRSLIDGDWIALEGERVPLTNPASGEPIGELALGTSADANRAVESAAKAFEKWSHTPLSKRIELMFALRDQLEANVEDLARVITREHGKTLDESRGDVRRGIEVVELCCGAQAYLAGDSQMEMASSIDALTWREPLGVCVGITPFNFPAMVPLWMFPVALVCGNTFVLKPSEKVPRTAVFLGELVQNAGFPEGVFNIVHGTREVVETLCTHSAVSAISFVGSTPVAEAVYRMGTHHGKRVQAAGGAKNAMVVMPDADPDSTLRGIIGAAYGCSGQRCMAGSLVMGVGEAADPLRERLCGAIDTIKVGDASRDEKVGMGPLVDVASRLRVLSGIDCGISEGAELVRDGRKGIPDTGNFVGPTLFDRVAPGSKLACQEWFGPLLSMQRPSDLEEAIEWINAHDYGNGAVICTSNGAAARRFAREVQCGMIGVNVAVPAALAPYSFSGWNRSFFGDLHVQGREGFHFYTRQKLVLSRWDDAYRRTLGW